MFADKKGSIQLNRAALVGAAEGPEAEAEAAAGAAGAVEALGPDANGIGGPWVGSADWSLPPATEAGFSAAAHQRLTAAVARRLPAEAGVEAEAGLQQAAAEILALQGPSYALPLQQLGTEIVQRGRWRRRRGGRRQALEFTPDVSGLRWGAGGKCISCAPS